MGFCPQGKSCSKEIWDFQVNGTRSYWEAKVQNEELRELSRKDRGVKTLLPSELEDKVLQMIKNMRQARCVVNCNIAIANKH